MSPRDIATKNLPLDVLVVDFLNMTKQGEMDLDPSAGQIRQE